MLIRRNQATVETLLVLARNLLEQEKSYNRLTREMGGRREGVGWGNSSREAQ